MAFRNDHGTQGNQNPQQDFSLPIDNITIISQ